MLELKDGPHRSIKTLNPLINSKQASQTPMHPHQRPAKTCISFFFLVVIKASPPLAFEEDAGMLLVAILGFGCATSGDAWVDFVLKRHPGAICSWHLLLGLVEGCWKADLWPRASSL